MNQNMQLLKEIKEKSDLIGLFLLNEIRSNVTQQQFADLSSKQLMLVEMLSKQLLTIREIASLFDMTASAASQMVKKLEELRFVKREINLENRREILVGLDKRGEAYIHAMETLEYELLEKYYGQLDVTDLIQLKEILTKLSTIMIKEGRDD